MIPFVLATIGGYLIGNSVKSQIFDKGGNIVLDHLTALDLQQTMANGGQVAQTILQQLGGANRLNAMTGAYNFYDIGDGLSFKIKNQRANYIKIKLNGMDLYDVEVGRIRGNTYKVVAEQDNLYFDQLKPFIEKATGMYLSL